MTSVLNIALGGMHRNQRAVEVSARNVANVNTDGYRALRYNLRTNTTT
ncbi:MAG: flagellar basal body protein, partial [Phycisphaerae bacterium]